MPDKKKLKELMKQASEEIRHEVYQDGEKLHRNMQQAIYSVALSLEYMSNTSSFRSEELYDHDKERIAEKLVEIANQIRGGY